MISPHVQEQKSVENFVGLNNFWKQSSNFLNPEDQCLINLGPLMMVLKLELLQIWIYQKNNLFEIFFGLMNMMISKILLHILFKLWLYSVIFQNTYFFLLVEFYLFF